MNPPDDPDDQTHVFETIQILPGHKVEDLDRKIDRLYAKNVARNPKFAAEVLGVESRQSHFNPNFSVIALHPDGSILATVLVYESETPPDSEGDLQQVWYELGTVMCDPDITSAGHLIVLMSCLAMALIRTDSDDAPILRVHAIVHPLQADSLDDPRGRGIACRLYIDHLGMLPFTMPPGLVKARRKPGQSDEDVRDLHGKILLLPRGLFDGSPLQERKARQTVLDTAHTAQKTLRNKKFRIQVDPELQQALDQILEDWPS